MNCLTSRKKRISLHIVQSRHEVIGSVCWTKKLGNHWRKTIHCFPSRASKRTRERWSTFGRWKEGRSSWSASTKEKEEGAQKSQCFFNWPVRKVQRCDDLLLIHQDKLLRPQSNKDEERKESKWRVPLEFDWSGQVSSPSHLRSADPPWTGVTCQWSRSTRPTANE